MSDKERLIQIFEHAVRKAWGEGFDYIDLSPRDGKKILELLKEREPRVMSAEEVTVGDWDYCYLEEMRRPQNQYLDKTTVRCILWAMTTGMDFDRYNKDWRCWNTRPTDEQRKAVKWE